VLNLSYAPCKHRCMLCGVGGGSMYGALQLSLALGCVPAVVGDLRGTIFLTAQAYWQGWHTVVLGFGAGFSVGAAAEDATSDKLATEVPDMFACATSKRGMQHGHMTRACNGTVLCIAL
jgi:hypothetical protein